MARTTSARRQFVWARSAGVLGPDVSDGVPFAADLLESVREAHGDAVLRGATVMAIRGYLFPFFQDETELALVRWRFGIKVTSEHDIGGPDETVRALGPWTAPNSDWMLFHQIMQIPSGATPDYASSSRGSDLYVESQAARKCHELGQTAIAWADVVDGNLEQADSGAIYYDLSLGLKLP